MRGDPAVIEALNGILTAELTAINQYFIHARMLENQKYTKLARHAQEESIGEMKHAQKVIDRILYLGGRPNMQKYMRINVGGTVKEMHEHDLELEKDAVDRLNKGIELARGKGDNGTRALLEEILKSEEEHIEVVREVERLWLDGRREEAEDLVPLEIGERTNLLGTPDLIVKSKDILVKANSPDWWGEIESVPIPLDEDRYVAAVEIKEVNDTSAHAAGRAGEDLFPVDLPGVPECGGHGALSDNDKGLLPSFLDGHLTRGVGSCPRNP